MLFFENDFEQAIQDSHYLECCTTNKNTGFSSITLSREDQELLMKTTRLDEQTSSFGGEVVRRKTIS